LNSSGAIAIGKIIGAHGLNGTSKVYSYAESPSIFKPDTAVTLRFEDGREEIFEINWSKPHRNIILLAFKGLTDRNQVKPLIGSEILLAKAALPEPGEDTYYWFDIIGLKVFSVDDQYLGRIEAIIPTGSNDVYVVKDPARGTEYELLIPALETVVLNIDTQLKVMRVDLPEGLPD